MSIKLIDLTSKKLSVSLLSSAELNVLSLVYNNPQLATIILNSVAKNRLLSELVPLSDQALIGVIKRFTEEADKSVLTDIVQLHLQQAKTDTAITTDVAIITALYHRVFTDNVGVADNIELHIFSNQKPVFNAVTFNSSTFG